MPCNSSGQIHPADYDRVRWLSHLCKKGNALATKPGDIKDAQERVGITVVANNNVNDNVNGFVKTNNYNDNVNGYDRARQVERIADELLRKFNLDESSRGFMCKVAYKLSEARIWQHYEKVTAPPKPGARPIANPVGMFIWLCKRDGV